MTQIAADDVGSLIRMAKCAERTGQFKDMLDCMHKVRPLPIPLAVPTARLYADRVGFARARPLCPDFRQVVKARGRTALTGEERDLLSLACKKVVGAVRFAWRSLREVIDDGDAPGTEKRM